MKPINLEHQMGKLAKFAEKLAATQSFSYIIRKVVCVMKNKHIGKPYEGI